jgi:hypothetical protein
MFIGKALEKIRVLDRLHKVDEQSAAVKELATQIAGNACLRCPQPSLPSNTLPQMRLEDHAKAGSGCMRRPLGQKIEDDR